MFVCFLIFRPLLGISVTFGHFLAVTRKSFCPLFVTYSKVIGASRNFFEALFVLFMFVSYFFGHLILVLFGHTLQITKSSKLFFCYASRYSKVIGASRNFSRLFLYCLCVFLDFFLNFGKFM